MGAYFSFERMITTSFVKVVYFLGFLLLTAAGIGLMVWAGLQLNDATIARTLGWRYVAFGAAILIVGNIVWRVACELWVVLFGIHDELVLLRYALSPVHTARVIEEPVTTREVVVRNNEVIRDNEIVAPRQAGVLGLS
ncbi:MAG TPA: DUF4282 domain-containing protein [Pyrinomonadaceae bacterium]|nr:DUF4282 domain-containing protein [Pyrinomonadaceae bacterium]